MIFPLLSFRTISAPPFVSENEENPILEILFGNESRASSFIKITKLSGSITASGKSFSELPITNFHPLNEKSLLVLL